MGGLVSLQVTSGESSPEPAKGIALCKSVLLTSERTLSKAAPPPRGRRGWVFCSVFDSALEPPSLIAKSNI